MKNSVILLVGFGFPAELSDALLRQGCEVRRADNPLTASLALIRRDIQLVLAVGSLDEQWNEFTEAIQGSNFFMQVDNLVSVQTSLATGSSGNGSNGSNGNGANGHHSSSDEETMQPGMSVEQLVVSGRATFGCSSTFQRPHLHQGGQQIAESEA